ncbi:MAG TPA: RNA polymerase sigma factor [Solirubrobacteraceae bacterium]|jgi:RNA polymerase sigma-70 factor (ECF subfamily)|nr:RNA polymerase sigma factor [Solirubrobacteraceae bacterium]
MADKQMRLARERFEKIYREHFDRVAAYLLARADRDLAADALSKTFEVAWRRIAEVPREPLPWLLGVARKVLADLRRGRGRQDALVKRIAATIAETGPDHSEALAERERTLAAFAGLSEPQREVLLLIAWDGLSQREAAAALGCSRGAVALRLHRARAGLRKALLEGSAENTAAPPDGELRPCPTDPIGDTIL